MSELQGGCTCGRNKYTILIPQDATDVARVFFDSSNVHRRSQAAPLSAWLRVPLAWYHSTTYAFFDDETHNAIRRTYTSPAEQHAKRHFCGFCGTPLSYWTEEPASHADYISLTLGSLASSDLQDLEELGLLPKEALEDAENDKQTIKSVTPHSASNLIESQGLPWFETMVEGSKLGRLRTSRGTRTANDGRTQVEWEIVEWTGEDDGQGPSATGKRKLDASLGS
ncbi:Glutathione-dependent formaldehyde-activating enzyme centromere V protein [Rutstroemia sp. NJR-2017a BBW]|nr:Glutathione-dependent formaldehyde-activating enzyme centromere V protein [Rutstroemia sp. NJR-2017a BBW]